MTDKEGRPMPAVVIHRVTEAEVRARINELADKTGRSLDELNDREARNELTAIERRRLDQIRRLEFLIGEDA